MSTAATAVLTGDPPPAPAPAPVPAAPVPAPANEAYFKDWPEDLRPIGEKYPGGPVEVAKALVNANKLIGVDPTKLLRLPADGDEEAQATLWNKLGRPEKADGYKVPDKMAAELKDDPMIPKYREAAHKLGLSGPQFEGLLGWFTTQGAELTAQSDEKFIATSAGEMDKLKGEWGAGFDRKVQAAQATLKKLGFSGDDAEAVERALGTRRFMLALSGAGEGLLEAVHQPGRPSASTTYAGLTPAEAKAERTRLGADPEFQKKLARNDAVALRQVRELTAMIANVPIEEFEAARAAPMRR